MSIRSKFRIIVAALANILLLTSCKFKEKDEAGNKFEETAKEIPNKFEALRSQAFNVTTEDLGVTVKDSLEVYGVIMDWGLDDETATLVSYASGDASLYLSSGGGIIGGGIHENVSMAAKELASDADTYFSESETPAIKYTMPVKGEVFFYFLTQKGVFTKRDSMENFEAGTSQLQSLFDNGNVVISELRAVSEK